MSFTRCRYCRHCRTPPAHRCPRRRRRQRVTEGTAMAPWNGPNKLAARHICRRCTAPCQLCSYVFRQVAWQARRQADTTFAWSPVFARGRATFIHDLSVCHSAIHRECQLHTKPCTTTHNTSVYVDCARTANPFLSASRTSLQGSGVVTRPSKEFRPIRMFHSTVLFIMVAPAGISDHCVLF